MINKILTYAISTGALTFGITLSGSALATGPALEKGHEYLLVANYPNNIHVIDTETDTLFKSCDLPGSFGPNTIQVAPDGKTAYILTNRYEDIYGIELDTCEVTFHAPMALKAGERTKSIFSIAISPDGHQHRSFKSIRAHFGVSSDLPKPHVCSVQELKNGQRIRVKWTYED